MIIKIHRVVKKDNVPVAYTVKVNGQKYPKGNCNFYFPKNGDAMQALSQACYDSGIEVKDNSKVRIISDRKVSIRQGGLS